MGSLRFLTVFNMEKRNPLLLHRIFKGISTRGDCPVYIIPCFFFIHFKKKVALSLSILSMSTLHTLKYAVMGIL